MVNIKTYRERQGLTQGQLAAKLEVTREYVNMLEAGRRSPSLALRKRMAKLFRLDIRKLL